MEKTNNFFERIFAAYKAANDQESLRKAQQSRASRYGINVHQQTHLTIPGQYAKLGATEADFADPVNFKYPVWLTVSADKITPTQLGMVRAAPGYFTKNKGLYSRGASVVNGRIQKALKKFGVGEFAKQAVQIISKNQERQLVYGIVLRPDWRDSHGDIISKEDVELAAHSWMLAGLHNDLQHERVLSKDETVPVESYIAPIDFYIGEYAVKQGDWVLGLYVPSQELWGKIKSGEISAFSIVGTGRRLPVA